MKRKNIFFSYKRKFGLLSERMATDGMFYMAASDAVGMAAAVLSVRVARLVLGPGSRLIALPSYSSHLTVWPTFVADRESWRSIVAMGMCNQMPTKR